MLCAVVVLVLDTDVVYVVVAHAPSVAVLPHDTVVIDIVTDAVDVVLVSNNNIIIIL